jgi:hypothetical protein
MMVDQKAYRSIEAVNWSSLKHLAVSPLHYRHCMDNPFADAVNLALGRATHTAVLEPDEFPLEYVVFDGKIRRGKEWDAFKEMHASRTILKRDEYRECLAKRDAVRRYQPARDLLAKGEAEKTIEWTDVDTGLFCKARLDWLGSSIVDLKGTKTIDARRFGQSAAQWGYYCQLAFYREGIRVLTGRELDCRIIAVEHEAPHDVAVFKLGEDDLYAGWEECRRLLKLLAECRETNRWPGRYESEQELSLPNWIREDDETATGLDLDWSSAKSTGGEDHAEDR